MLPRGGTSLFGPPCRDWVGIRLHIEAAIPAHEPAVGHLTADGNGNLSGSEMQSNNGTVVTKVTEKGSYTVNPDWSGSATLTMTMTGATEPRDTSILRSSTTQESLSVSCWRSSP